MKNGSAMSSIHRYSEKKEEIHVYTDGASGAEGIINSGQ
jgi:hypothetical protein